MVLDVSYEWNLKEDWIHMKVFSLHPTKGGNFHISKGSCVIMGYFHGQYFIFMGYSSCIMTILRIYYYTLLNL